MRLARRARGALARSCDAGSHRVARCTPMIAKTFFLTKEIRAIRTKKLRQKKSLRDHQAMTPSARRARPHAPAPGSPCPRRSATACHRSRFACPRFAVPVQDEGTRTAAADGAADRLGVIGRGSRDPGQQGAGYSGIELPGVSVPVRDRCAFKGDGTAAAYRPDVAVAEVAPRRSRRK
jgi:hypothetical protein